MFHATPERRQLALWNPRLSHNATAQTEFMADALIQTGHVVPLIQQDIQYKVEALKIALFEC